MYNSAEIAVGGERIEEREESDRLVKHQLQTGEENCVAAALSACGLPHPQIALIGNGSTATAACRGIFSAGSGLGYISPALIGVHHTLVSTHQYQRRPLAPCIHLVVSCR